jgi:hypothetical protein
MDVLLELRLSFSDTRYSALVGCNCCIDSRYYSNEFLDDHV